MAAATRQLPARANRGKRTKELIGEEKEVDELFWKTNGVYVDTVDDEDYELEPEKEDKFDEDFWQTESESEEEGDRDKEVADPQPKNPPKHELKKPRKPQRRLKIGPQPSQRELLEEAASTEMWNQHRLLQMMKFEETKVQRLGSAGRRMVGPAVKTVDSISSGRRKVFLTYSPEFPLTPFPKAVKPNKTAKYRDPKSGLEFNTAEEFKKARNQFLAQQENELQARIKSLKETLAKKKEALEQFDLKITMRCTLSKFYQERG